MQVPTILVDNKILTLDTSTKATITILQFADDRRKIDIGDFLPRHIETLAQVFKSTVDAISRNLTPAQVILTYLDILTYTAKTFTRIAKEYADQRRQPRYIDQLGI